MAIIRFPIDMKPLPFLHMTQKEKILLRIPEDCPKHCGLPRRSSKAPMVDYVDFRTGKTKQRRYGCPHMLSVEGLQRKNRVQRYNEYKVLLRALALEMGFTLPHAGCAIYFFMPMSMETQRRNKLRERMEGAPHLVKPDTSNLLKSVEDALDSHDQHIYHYAGIGKFWTSGSGYIEFHTDLPVYDPRAVEEGVWLTKNAQGDYETPSGEIVPTVVSHRKVDIGGGRILHTTSPASYDGEKIENPTHDELLKYEDSFEKKAGEYSKEYLRDLAKSLFGGPVDVNDKQAMDEIIRGNKKRKRKK